MTDHVARKTAAGTKTARWKKHQKDYKTTNKQTISTRWNTRHSLQWYFVQGFGWEMWIWSCCKNGEDVIIEIIFAFKRKRSNISAQISNTDTPERELCILHKRTAEWKQLCNRKWNPKRRAFDANVSSALLHVRLIIMIYNICAAAAIIRQRPYSIKTATIAAINCPVRAVKVRTHGEFDIALTKFPFLGSLT